MTVIIGELAEVAGRYDALFCDLWGCLHDGVTAFPPAVAALLDWRAQGGTVLLLTNSPRPRASVIMQLDRMGVPRDAWDEVVTSGDAAQFALLSGVAGRRVFAIAGEKDDSFFTEFAADLAEYAAGQPTIQRVARMEDAEGIVCTGLRVDLTETPEDYRAELARGVALGLPMLCANPDIVVDWGGKRLFCAGALARDYEEMGGRALYFGKPHAPIYALARRRLAALRPEARVLCVGDGAPTDILGAAGQGLDALFVTGGIDAAAFGPDSERPEAGLLEDWLRAKGLPAAWAIGHLR